MYLDWKLRVHFVNLDLNMEFLILYKWGTDPYSCSAATNRSAATIRDFTVLIFRQTTSTISCIG